MLNKVIKKISENGTVIALKTDTVYGLVANANDKTAVEKIYNLKKREHKKPLGIFIKNINELDKYVDMIEIPKNVLDLINLNWPGALTVIFKKKIGVFDYLTSGKSTIGIRIPNNTFLLDLLNNIPFPLVQTSCNISGEEPYLDATTIVNVFGNSIDMIVDGGKVINNVASTIIDVSSGDINVLRKGNLLI